MLSPPVVPGETGFATAKSAAAKEAGFNQEAQMLAKTVKMNLSGRGGKRMLMQNDNAFPAFSGDPFESNA